MKKIILLTFFISASVFAGTIQFNTADGATEFLAVGKPAMIKINGKGPGPEGTLNFTVDKITGTLKVDLKKLTTEIDLRDEHMKNKYLEVQKYPTADLTFNELKLPVAVDALTDKETDVPFTAEFTLHGKTNPVVGMAHIKNVQKKITGTATFNIPIMKYLETLPSYAGIKIAEEVTVKIKLSGTLQ